MAIIYEIAPDPEAQGRDANNADFKLNGRSVRLSNQAPLVDGSKKVTFKAKDTTTGAIAYHYATITVNSSTFCWYDLFDEDPLNATRWTNTFPIGTGNSVTYSGGKVIISITVDNNISQGWRPQNNAPAVSGTFLVKKHIENLSYDTDSQVRVGLLIGLGGNGYQWGYELNTGGTGLLRLRKNGSTILYSSTENPSASFTIGFKRTGSTVEWTLNGITQHSFTDSGNLTDVDMGDYWDAQSSGGTGFTMDVTNFEFESPQGTPYCTQN